ncbi:MAG: BufA1 family periplasmic bufferin-type metallophore [Betaproteobacteria bacterium]
MTKSNALIASAVAAALALPGTAVGGPAPKPTFNAEKCFGIAKAGKNDCQTANSACATTSKRDSQADAWVYMPVGACTKVVGGSLQPRPN